MRKSIVAAATVAAVLAFAVPAGKAAAMPVATPNQVGLSGSAGVEKTVLICGPWGCYWRPWGWYRPIPIGVGGAIIGGAGTGLDGGGDGEDPGGVGTGHGAGAAGNRTG